MLQRRRPSRTEAKRSDYGKTGASAIARWSFGYCHRNSKVRFKTTATVMHGMGGFGDADSRSGQPARPAKKKKRFGLGDILNGTIPNP